jgi:hypothetical protein
MRKVNEVYMVSFIIDDHTHQSAITIIKPNSDGTLKAVKLIKDEDKCKKIYNLLLNS